MTDSMQEASVTRTAPRAENADPLACVACQSGTRSVGLVCAECAEAIAPAPTMVRQQIVAVAEYESEAALVDQWGRAYVLGTSTYVGRVATTNDLRILDASVSRQHARIVRIHGVWSVLDLKSSNGTYVNRERVTEHVLAHGDRIAFGIVTFYIVFDIERHPDVSTITSIRSSSPLPDMIARLGVEQVSTRLTTTQLELVHILARRMQDEAHLPWMVRGFVRSSELLGVLSWDARCPRESHVKQLVRRVRRTLVRLGLGDLIESRHRFGYRLRPPCDSNR